MKSFIGNFASIWVFGYLDNLLRKIPFTDKQLITIKLLIFWCHLQIDKTHFQFHQSVTWVAGIFFGCPSH